MKKSKQFLALVGCALLLSLTSGCGDKAAEDLAEKLIAVANSYQEQVDRTSDVERKVYKKLASTYVDAQRNNVFGSLAEERIERARLVADEAVEVKRLPLTISEIESQLRAYADVDFEATRTLMKDESEARAQYLSQLAKLKNDSVKVEALTQSFSALAKSKTKVDQVKEMIEFFQQSKQEFDKLFCENLKTKIDNVQKDVTARQKGPSDEKPDAKAQRLAALEHLEAELDALKAEKTAKKCN
jgi:hypothetical protein